MEANTDSGFTDEFRYEVAFSFVAQDEGLATDLDDLIQDRLSTFLYSKRQEELAGTDGEETFGKAFGEQARCVVVLYREGWGKSPWTRIEETAIGNRAFEYGYDFVLFIPLDNSGVPRWLPRTQLWLGLERWGRNAAAAVIEARVQELGGNTRSETVEDRAKRLQRSLDFKEARKRFLESGDGVASANTEFAELADELERQVAAIKEATGSEKYGTKRHGHEFALLGPRSAMGVAWQIHYVNSFDDSKLGATIFIGHPPMSNALIYGEPTRRGSKTFDFDLLGIDRPGWRLRGEDRGFETSELAQYLMKWFLDDADQI